MKELDPKAAALLSLEAAVMTPLGERRTALDEVANLISAAELALRLSHPERLLDPLQRRAFEKLVVGFLGGERRRVGERRGGRERYPSGAEQRRSERRWVAVQND